jgi:uncharacterized protein YceH (UPF0502 family)
MDIELSQKEVRVIGCLLEKSVTTPDQYPLTLNALTNACNQKSSRDPVMELSQGEVKNTLQILEDNFLITRTEPYRGGTEKFEQRLCNTLLGKHQFSAAEYAIICLLMLRGPQTPGELRSRGGRLYSFADNQEVTDTLLGMIEREGGAIVARLPRTPGRKDSEYMHLFAGDIESVPEDASVVNRPPRDDRISRLETRIEVLEAVLTDLATRLGEEIHLVEVEPEDD